GESLPAPATVATASISSGDEESEMRAAGPGAEAGGPPALGNGAKILERNLTDPEEDDGSRDRPDDMEPEAGDQKSEVRSQIPEFGPPASDLYWRATGEEPRLTASTALQGAMEQDIPRQVHWLAELARQPATPPLSQADLERPHSSGSGQEP